MALDIGVLEKSLLVYHFMHTCERVSFKNMCMLIELALTNVQMFKNHTNKQKTKVGTFNKYYVCKINLN